MLKLLPGKEEIFKHLQQQQRNSDDLMIYVEYDLIY